MTEIRKPKDLVIDLTSDYFRELYSSVDFSKDIKSNQAETGYNTRTYEDLYALNDFFGTITTYCDRIYDAIQEKTKNGTEATGTIKDYKLAMPILGEFRAKFPNFELYEMIYALDLTEFISAPKSAIRYFVTKLENAVNTLPAKVKPYTDLSCKDFIFTKELYIFLRENIDTLKTNADVLPMTEYFFGGYPTRIKKLMAKEFNYRLDNGDFSSLKSIAGDSINEDDLYDTLMSIKDTCHSIFLTYRYLATALDLPELVVYMFFKFYKAFRLQDIKSAYHYTVLPDGSFEDVNERKIAHMIDDGVTYAELSESITTLSENQYKLISAYVHSPEYKEYRQQRKYNISKQLLG